MIRRTFLKTLIAGAGASILDRGRITPEAEAAVASPGARSKPAKGVIGGAGITGLCCGYELMKAGFDVTILEASGRYGGHVFTGRDGLSDGLYADLGADHITKPGYERFFAYAEEFKLPVKEVHKMSVAQLDKEMKSVGLIPVRRIETLPLQHILIFGKG